MIRVRFAIISVERYALRDTRYEIRDTRYEICDIAHCVQNVSLLAP